MYVCVLRSSGSVRPGLPGSNFHPADTCGPGSYSCRRSQKGSAIGIPDRQRDIRFFEEPESEEVPGARLLLRNSRKRLGPTCRRNPHVGIRSHTAARSPRASPELQIENNVQALVSEYSVSRFELKCRQL